MGSFNLVSQGDFSTVLANKDELKKRPKSREYQSESQLEKEFIDSLCDLGYDYMDFHDEKGLERNLRGQIERLNGYRFSDADWDRFCNEVFSNLDREKATSIIQENSVKDFTDERGELHNIKLIDKENLFRNSCQVIEQFIDDTDDGRQKNRYDVTILVNGLPLVHCELKKRDVRLKNAFNQIDRYKARSFSDGMGLFNFIQIFVISNGADTRYYSNTVEQNRRADEDDFKFACRWTDRKNRHISDLDEFAEAFFNKHTLLSLLTRYCVFTAKDEKGGRRLLVMRPYQVAAAEKVLEKINQARLNGNFGKERQGGYVWHTTGSGKTLTSFKAATLASRMEGVDKVLVVVDRQDLDYQTIKEYNSYEEGCVDFTSNSSRLKAQMEDGNRRLIVTTIQKLNALCRRKEALEKVKNLNTVFIFDECHRSQFGKMHSNIVNNFKKYLLFGFTGTPIFESDKKTSSEGREIEATTPNIFGERLHEYTVVHAINDGTVLPFQYSHVGPGAGGSSAPSQARIKANVEYIVKNFKAYTHKGRYNSILATESIPAAKEYWEALMDAQAEWPENSKMAIAIVYSSAGEDGDDMDLDADKPENRAFLAEAVSEYNRRFNCSFSMQDAQSFQDYYRDVSEKMKARVLDLLIVVNMFLTGFDSKRLNTLWVDKNLRKHNLIQAFSRTNRILDSAKDRGIIVSFRDLEGELDESLRIYGADGKTDKGLIFGRTYRELMDGWTDKEGRREGYRAIAQKFQGEFPAGEEIVGEKAKRKFVDDWNELLKKSNLLSTFPDFEDENPISPRDVQTYSGTYLDIREQFKSNITEEDAAFKGVEWEDKLLSQKEIDVDYILDLNLKGATRDDIDRVIDSSPDLRRQKEIILKYLNDLGSPSGKEAFEDFRRKEREKELDQLIKNNNLKPEKAREFCKEWIRTKNPDPFTGRSFADILPAMSFFGKEGEERERKKAKVRKEFWDWAQKYAILG